MHVHPSLSRILAGIATPIVAVFFWQLAEALNTHDISSLPYSVVLVPAAVVLGAPFAIAVALFVRVRNTSKAVPLVAVAAAIGIAVQVHISGRFQDTNTISFWLMLVWVVPAIFGTVAALLLKWQEQLASLCIATLAIVTALILSVGGLNSARERAPAYAAADSWSKLHIGMSVYTGQTGSASGQAVCPTLADFFGRENNSF